MALQHNTVVRKAALKSSFEPLPDPNFVAGDDLPALVADALMCTTPRSW